jgi:hypothetical protein
MPDLPELARRALDHALSSIDGGAELIPFVLVATPGGHDLVRVVTSASDRAIAACRSQARERRASGEAYCLAVETFLRRGEERIDGLLIECGVRGEPEALRFIQPFRRREGPGVERLDDPLPFGAVRSAFLSVIPLDLLWGSRVTPDFLNERTYAVHWVAHEFGSQESLWRTIRFLRARIRYQARHLPRELKAAVAVDARGGAVPEATREALRRELGPDVAWVRFHE